MTPFKKVLHLVQEIGNIMYVGGILSHIVIGIALGHDDANTAYLVYLYKEISAYWLILPGLGLKIAVDLILYSQYAVKPIWLKIKMVMMAFLTINAFVFLVPMMPEMVALAEASLPFGDVSQAFLDRAWTEQMIGMSNIIPLISEILLGSFRPIFASERQQQGVQ